MTVLPFVSRATREFKARVKAMLAEPIVLTAEEHDDRVRWNKFVAVMIQTDDLRLRVGLSTPTFLGEQPPIRNQPALRLATLIDACGSCDDPVALSMLVLRCMHEEEGAYAADGARLALRWTEIEPDNHLAWIVLATIRWGMHEPEEAIETMRRGAGAKHWREHEVFFARAAVAAMATPYFTPRQRLCAISSVQCLLLQRAADSTVAFVHEAAQDRVLRPLIVEALAAKWRDADSPHALAWSGIEAASAGLDDATIAERTRRADAYSWESELRSPIGRPVPRHDAAFDAAFDVVAHAYHVGERQIFTETLAAAGVDEAEAARLHVAGLDARRLELRASLMAPRPLVDAPMRGPLLHPIYPVA